MEFLINTVMNVVFSKEFRVVHQIKAPIKTDL